MTQLIPVWTIRRTHLSLIFFSQPAQIQAKGNSIVEANIKIVNNGSYSFTLEGGTVLNITVYVAPCGKCMGSDTRMSGERAQSQSIRPFHQESTSSPAIEQVCEARADPEILQGRWLVVLYYTGAQWVAG